MLHSLLQELLHQTNKALWSVCRFVLFIVSCFLSCSWIIYCTWVFNFYFKAYFAWKMHILYPKIVNTHYDTVIGILLKQTKRLVCLKVCFIHHQLLPSVVMNNIFYLVFYYVTWKISMQNFRNVHMLYPTNWKKSQWHFNIYRIKITWNYVGLNKQVFKIICGGVLTPYWVVRGNLFSIPSYFLYLCTLLNVSKCNYLLGIEAQFRRGNKFSRPG